ncbi:Similar to ANK1: Ankyrin-1 (Homo sapiens) [Cotesia congregata]|uniref:Similar to ANK1: Ankyrin-1 (Homo sapiens) n=1 Tax=Cotesia congregata TaxID=51543 RepID=A0A8J2HN19_COTCN|nr:Similar to ANK1: Ankyrin-1 (Homo sapiens) [Cotesia congregata]
MSTLMRNLKTTIVFGDIKKVKKLLKSLAPIPLSKNPLIFGGYSLLKLAIKLRNRKEIVKLLIKKGARVNKKYCDKSSPLLHIAIRQQHLDIVKLLVKKGANVNEPDHHNMTPMFVTIESLQMLSRESPTIDIMKFLIRKGADIQAKDEEGCTALALSCGLHQFRMTRLLLKLNCNVNSTTIFDSNSISIAVLTNSWKVASLLLKYNAWANSTISDMTISYCSGYYRDLPARRLNSLGENPTLTKSFKRTPLMLAIEEISSEIVHLLLKKGARIDDLDEDGTSPLYYLICNPNNVNSRLNVEMIERYRQSKKYILIYLINAGVNVNETSESGGTKLKFLTMALTYGEEHIVKYLVECFDLDFMLVDHEILEKVKLNTTLLSEEQLEDQQFMNKLKKSIHENGV